MAVEESLIDFTTLAISLGLLVFGVSLLFFLRGRGGPEIALARLLADSRRRTMFLAALCTSLAALFGIGLVGGLASFSGASFAELNFVRATLFGIGAIGLFILMVDALRTSPLTLEESWNLKETAARVSSAPNMLAPPIALAPPPFSQETRPRRPGI